MAFRSCKDLKLILHPYLFVLKEGTKIQKDYLDYSLLMLQVTSPEVIKSPQRTLQHAPLLLKDNELFNFASQPTTPV